MFTQIPTRFSINSVRLPQISPLHVAGIWPPPLRIAFAKDAWFYFEVFSS